MWFNIDFRLHAVNMLLVDMRNAENSAFAQIVLRPIENLHREWKAFRKQNIYKLEHTGQVCLLRKSLNDNFDPVERRIYIGDGNIFDKYYIYTGSEANKKHTSTKAENNYPYLRTKAETANTGFDFIVFGPQEIIDQSIHGLTAHIQYYKKGSKRYTIMAIN